MSLWHDSNTFTSIKYDQYRITRQLFKSIQIHHHYLIADELIVQGLGIICS